MILVEEIQNALKELALPEKKDFYPRFFKAGKGEYAEGDKFIGVTVPDQRKVVKAYFQKISLEELRELLSSRIHEYRHSALLMLVSKYEKSKDPDEKLEIVKFYLKNRKHINNWDLVDNSCYKILGRHCLENQEDELLRALANEDRLWSKRMAVVSTMFHVKKGKFELVKELVLKNLSHEHDLMHKANGWLLRVMGQKNEDELLAFLKDNYHKMPRTSLRYAIEKLDEDLRQKFLKGKF
ncbi:DNA alkylation repair protein [Chryseobacterium sp. R2A-55]|uniref:DNA alkylation repair protein n=1 Tax=Chryseobacterium sp. R2A-55 TaxID=2744445 RepID=UPI001F21F7E9|nr:DNA alkylation repair protein [Chryseobacterium sp. R2A-55]